MTFRNGEDGLGVGVLDLQKASMPKPEDIVADMQALRDQAETEGDVESAGVLTECVRLFMGAIGLAGVPEEESPEEDMGEASEEPTPAGEGATSASASPPAPGDEMMRSVPIGELRKTAAEEVVPPVRLMKQAAPFETDPDIVFDVVMNLSRMLANIGHVEAEQIVEQQDAQGTTLTKMADEFDARRIALEKFFTDETTELVKRSDLQALAGDLAQIAVAVDTLEERLAKATSSGPIQPMLIEVPGTVGQGVPGTISFSTLEANISQIEDPTLRASMQHQLTLAQIKQAQLNGVVARP